ncbi:SpoIIE family protein phosphatase [Nonomuraea terrae]|uniref:SpoIIE family protein phosphatase n=1 Tax=Nonomuraea terrae TaxID=2530383 RepID=UPI0037A5B575
MAQKVEENTSGGLALDVFSPALVGVAVTSGPDHRLIYTDDAYRTIFGDRSLDVPFREALRDLLQSSYFSQLDHVYTTGESLSLREVPFELGNQGQERYASISISKVSLGRGRTGVLMMVMEVTDRVHSARMIESIAESRRRFLQRYQSLLQIDTQVVWVTDANTQAIEPSPGWQRMTGQTWNETRGMGYLRAVHPEDRGAVKDEWAAASRTMRLFDNVARVRMADGNYRHVRTRAVPVIEDDTVIEWVGACSDVEQEWQEERHKRLLDQAAAATATMADPDEVLRMLTNVIVPNVADACGIYLLPEFDGEPPHPLVVERFVSIVREGDDLQPPVRPGTISLESDCGFVEAVRTRQPVHRVFPPGQAPPGLAPPGAAEWFRANGINSMALLPVIVDGAVAAVFDAVICGDREPISGADVDLLNRLVDHAHAHLSNARRFQRTQRVALAFQHYLLPDPPQVPGLEIIARYRPSTTAAEVGGDWYDCFRLRDGSAILTIGDVAGHDLAAAVTMSQLRNMLRGLAMDRDEPPGDILRRLNVATESLYGEVTATCVLARLEHPADGEWRLTYAVAGHPPPLLVTRHGEARYLEGAADPLLGLLDDWPRSSTVAPLPRGSTLLLYTDGLIEHPGEHLDEGPACLLENAASLAREPLDVLCDQLLTRMSMAAKDDIAIMALRPPGP